MASKLQKLDWEEYFSTKTDKEAPNMESGPTLASGGIDASDLSPAVGMTKSSQKRGFFDFLSCMGESATPELQIVSGRASGGVNLPQVGVAGLSDHMLNDKFDPRFRRSICSSSDMDDSFISHVQLYQSEPRRSSIIPTPKDIRECKVCTDFNSTESGTNASKADAAFEKELSSMGRDKHEGLHKVGLQMYRKPQQLHFRSQANEFMYLDEFSRCGANMCEETVPSTSCRGAQLSSSCSLPQRKSSRLLSKRRKACLDWDLLDWEFEKDVEKQVRVAQIGKIISRVQRKEKVGDVIDPEENP